MTQKLDSPRSPALAFAATPEEWMASEVIDCWERSLADSDNPNALFQSPAWFNSQHETGAGTALLWQSCGIRTAGRPE